MSASTAANPAETVRGSISSRLSDLLNPILVREVQQAVKGRVFVLTILVALAVSVVIAVVVASDYLDGVGDGGSAFNLGFATLVPLILFVVPMQAYNSMRTEMRGGIVEQLLMSRLGPGRVLFGKLQAAMVQFLLYVSVLAPLVATSYLLRGVDLPTIAVSLLLALLVCITATAFAVSSAAQAVAPSMQGLANLGVAFGLGIGTFTLVGIVGSGAYATSLGAVMRSGSFSMTLSAVVLVAGLSTTLSWLTARSFLLHAFENKSTAFRIFLMLLPAIAFGWMLGFTPSRMWSELFLVFLSGLVVLGLVFGVFMVTEQQKLSPRVHAHAPASPLRATLMAPLYPGRDRGMLCLVVFLAMLALIALIFWPSSLGSGFRVSRFAVRVALMTTAYALIYLGLGRWLRHRLPETAAGSSAARILIPSLLFLFILVPCLVDALALGGVRGWHIGHAMNPFWTVSYFVESRWDSAFGICLGVLGVAFLLQAPVMRRGIAEMRAAARARSERDSGAPAEPPVVAPTAEAEPPA
ncbi:MAG: hypothetical protein AB8H80_07995 [Planctomycetota bacterium]